MRAQQYPILTGNGARTTTELVEIAVERVVCGEVRLVRQNTTLYDVFVHYNRQAAARPNFRSVLALRCRSGRWLQP